MSQKVVPDAHTSKRRKSSFFGGRKKSSVFGGSRRSSTGSAVERSKSRRNSFHEGVMGAIASFKKGNTFDAAKFEEIMQFTADASIFSENDSSAVWEQLGRMAKQLVEAERYYLYLIDKENNLLTAFYTHPETGQPIERSVSVGREVAGSVAKTGEGVSIPNVAHDPRYDPTFDQLNEIDTKSVLCYPLKTPDGAVTGVLELQNKEKGVFTVHDEQLIRMFVVQVGTSLHNFKQMEKVQEFDKQLRQTFELDDDEHARIGAMSTATSEYGDSLSQESPRLMSHMVADELGLSSQHNPALREWGFDIWQLHEQELFALTVDIFEDLGLFVRYSVPVDTFYNFVSKVCDGYRATNPYHTFFHAFDVAHVSYLFVATCGAEAHLEAFNIMSLVVAALVHDLGHDGVNNPFHVNTSSDLAITYNNISVLENFSAAQAYRILKDSTCNIFANLSQGLNVKMRQRIIEMVLDTDAKSHFVLMTRFKHALEMKKLSRGLFCSILLHSADVSNPVRPFFLARRWAQNVQEEFFAQGDKERAAGLSVSPFMDREQENLPRLQMSFIDAVVCPLFNLMSTFLPAMKQKCITEMEKNRVLWKNAMNNPSLILSSPLGGPPRTLGDANQSQLSPTRNVKKLPPVSNLTAIPGIPDNAPQSPRNLRARRDSTVDMEQDKPEDDADADALKLAEDAAGATLKERIVRTMEKPKFQLVLMVATVFALFGDDLNMAFSPPSHDFAVQLTSLVVFVLFAIELILCTFAVKNYLSFYFWLDLVAALSMLPDIDFLWGQQALDETGGLGIARAGRAAKAGARAGRLARLLRLVRLIRIFKILKLMKSGRAGYEETTRGDDATNMSVVGRRMTEAISRKVILSVMFMLVVFSFQQTIDTKDSRLYGLTYLDSMDDGSVSAYVTDYIDFHDTILQLRLNNETLFDDIERLEDIRTGAIELVCPDDPCAFTSTQALFDMSSSLATESVNSLLLTLVVTLLLAFLSMVFSRDAHRIMIAPIEKMQFTVQQLSHNPLLHIQTLDCGGDVDETDMLQMAIMKMARLLQVGFGAAGAAIIAKNLAAGGAINPMVPGTKVTGLFGFCDIRRFTEVTECLQESTMLFVNQIADIVHRYVVESGGAPNKNIGDAFLLVWRLNENQINQKEIFDCALLACLRIMRELDDSSEVAYILEQHADKMTENKLQNYVVQLGFGLHTGWAIEGSIGSPVKVDASYLSPHVNASSRLESATKQYGVKMLLSQDFVFGLSGALKGQCRKLDRVVLKGVNGAMDIYTFEAENEQATITATEEEITGTETPSLKEDDKARFAVLLASTQTAAVRQVYEYAFDAYTLGKWQEAKDILHLWLVCRPADKSALRLLEFMGKSDFQAPAKWKGYHHLDSK